MSFPETKYLFPSLPQRVPGTLSAELVLISFSPSSQKARRTTGMSQALSYLGEVQGERADRLLHPQGCIYLPSNDIPAQAASPQRSRWRLGRELRPHPGITLHHQPGSRGQGAGFPSKQPGDGVTSLWSPPYPTHHHINDKIARSCRRSS